MSIEDKGMRELLELHNAIADAPAGPKTFATKAKLLVRLKQVAESKGIDLASYCVPGAASASSEAQHSDAEAHSTEAATEPKVSKKRGLGVGELARVLLMDPAGYPHALIATMVNAQIEGAAATHKSVRWYAAKMRKEGIGVPARAKAFPAFMDEKQSAEYLGTVTVVQEEKK